MEYNLINRLIRIDRQNISTLQCQPIKINIFDTSTQVIKIEKSKSNLG